MKKYPIIIIAFFFLGLTQIQQSYIESYKVDGNYVEIRLIKDFYKNPTDGYCQKAGEVFHAICKQGYKLYVIPDENGFAPSRVNPMTVEWTKELIN